MAGSGFDRSGRVAAGLLALSRAGCPCPPSLFGARGLIPAGGRVLPVAAARSLGLLPEEEEAWAAVDASCVVSRIPRGAVLKPVGITVSRSRPCP